LQQGLEYREGRQVVDPGARRDVWGQVRQRVGESDQRLGDAESKTGGDSENKPIDRLGEVGAVGQEECRDGFERLLDHRDQQPQDQHTADADARPAKRAGEVLEGVVDHALEEGDDDAYDNAAPDRESEHDRRFVAVDLSLVQIDQVQDRDQEGRDQDRGGYQTCHV